VKSFKRVGAIRLVAGCLGLSSIFCAYTLATASECASDSECKPGYVCSVKTDVKKGKTTTKSECKKDPLQCEADTDCNPGYVCLVKTDVKKGKTTTKSECKKDPLQCEADTDCNPGYFCLVKTDPKKGTTKSECKKDDRQCLVDADCKAGSHCEADGKCKKNDKCDDRDACTNDVNEGGGKCSHTPIPGCASACTAATDCDDAVACTTDACNAGVCTHDATNCSQCTTAADCADGDACTTEECASDGTCRISPIPGCGQPEAQEICGDCIDNDGNGLTDFEDPACCGQSFSMALSRGRIVPRGQTSRLRIKSVLARTGLASINPIKQDVFLQIRSVGAQDILCARVPAGKFKARGRGFTYSGRKNPAPSAQGIRGLRLKMKKDGSVRFSAVGRRVNLSNAKAGAVQITVGFHDAANDATSRCSATTASFRDAKRKSIVAK
jgi:Dickkopf N-terminal cysteine-rich region